MRYKKSAALVMFLAGMLFVQSVLAVNTTCLTNNTLQVNSTYYIIENGNTTAIDVTKEVYCPFGCSNNNCEGANVAGDSTSVWLTYAIGATLLVLGTVLGIPRSEIGKTQGFDTKVVVRFMFFFVGMFMVYLSMGMASRLGTVYGGESNIIGGMNASTIAILLTLVLFFFVFVIELFYNIVTWLAGRKEEKKWGGYEV